jgi:hypothetical protein
MGYRQYLWNRENLLLRARSNFTGLGCQIDFSDLNSYYEKLGIKGTQLDWE